MSKTILIVEDNPMNMKLFNDLLQAHNYNTVQTTSGHNAKELAREHQPDLIIMDIQLPEISGLDITKEMKAEDGLKHIPVIAVTAFAMKGDEDKMLAGGCDAYISKPICIRTFIETIERHIG